MAIIPQYSDQPVKQEALPNVRFQTDQPTEAFGGGPSLTALTQATQGALGSAEKVAEQYKYHADQVAYTGADAEASKLQTEIQVDVSNMQGEDALKAQDYAFKKWNDGLDEIRSGLSNDTQVEAFNRASLPRGNELNKSILIHVNNETKQLDNQKTDSFLNESKNAAIVNAGDNERVMMERERSARVVTDQARREGLGTDPGSASYEVYQNKLRTALSPFDRDVIQQKLNSGLDEDAKKYFDAHKLEMTNNDVLHTESAIENQDVITQGRDIFQNMPQGMKFPDGSYNMDKVRSYVEDQTDGLSSQRSQRVVEQVARKAAEFNTDKAKEEQQVTRAFTNEVLTMRKNNVPMDQAMQRVSKYATDPYDVSVKSDIVGKIYAPPSESDPATYLALKQKNLYGDGSRREMDQALLSGKINLSDHRKLTEEDLKNKIEGTDSLTKNAWEDVKILAGAQLGTDKDKYQQFMYVMHHDADGKSADEIVKIAHDKLKNDPNTGVFGWGWTQSPAYKAQAAQLDAKSISMGQLNQDVGQEQAQAIGSAITMSTGKPWGLKGVDDFAGQFGGYSHIKKGTPANNAIESLRLKGELATPANVKAVLKKYPDGNF